MTEDISSDTRTNLGIRAKQEFMNFLEEVEVKELFNTKVKGKFLLIEYTYDKNREEDFLKFIFNHIPTYALSRDERENLTPEDTGKIFELWKVALDRFVKNPNTGEFGEIILFHLLELLEGAVQIVNKMALKTAGGVYSYGADAIHFGFDGNLKVLYLGESKTTESTFSGALNKSLNTVDEYYYKQKGKKEFEINLASGNISNDIPEPTRTLIKDYLNPSKKGLSDFKEVHAIFLGFQMNILKELENKYNSKYLLKKVIESYKEDIQGYIKKIESKFGDFPDLEGKRFLFFVIPFKNLADLKERFSNTIKNGKKVNI